MEIDIDKIDSESFCRLQKRKQVQAIIEYIKQYNEENDGMVKIIYSFDDYYSIISIAYYGAIEVVEIIDVDNFFIEIYKGNR